MKSSITFMACCLLSAFSVSLAQAEIQSGPAAGDKLQPLKVADVTGDFAGEKVDYAAKRKEKPTFYIFIQAEG